MTNNFVMAGLVPAIHASLASEDVALDCRVSCAPAASYARGALRPGNDEKGQGGQPFKSPTYACRPPGVFHGPFKSEEGCLLYEIHYYDETRPFSGATT